MSPTDGWPEVVHAAVVELAALVDHPAGASLLVLRNIELGFNTLDLFLSCYELLLPGNELD